MSFNGGAIKVFEQSHTEMNVQVKEFCWFIRGREDIKT
jgi:hypothetical protein